MYMLFWNLRCDNYSRETTIQGRKLLISKTFLVRQVFKGDNYSREETIRGNTVFELHGRFCFQKNRELMTGLCHCTLHHVLF